MPYGSKLEPVFWGFLQLYKSLESLALLVASELLTVMGSHSWYCLSDGGLPFGHAGSQVISRLPLIFWIFEIIWVQQITIFGKILFRSQTFDWQYFRMVHIYWGRVFKGNKSFTFGFFVCIKLSSGGTALSKNNLFVLPNPYCVWSATSSQLPLNMTSHVYSALSFQFTGV